MPIIRRDVPLAGGLIVVLLAAVWAAAFVTSRTVNHLLLQDAEVTGEAWARYLAANVADLEQIAAGQPPSPESITFFEKAQQVGDVFLYKIFDAEGGLRLVSNELDTAGQAAESIPAHNPGAAEVVLEGKTRVEVKEGTSPDRPAFYSEAYVPVVVEGEIIGIVEVYVDQSGKRTAFHSRIGGVAGSLAAIIAVAFGLPALGFYWRTRQKRQADSRAEFLADHDPLTELLNRARFMRDLNEAVALGCPVAVHCIDVDRFREINETLGQTTGDEVLRQFARRLRTLSDTTDLVARIGGDDFALAQIMHSPKQVTRTARQILAAADESCRFADREIETSVTVGSAVAPAHGQDAAALMKSAEIALARAKSEGFGSRALFRPEMDAELQERRKIEALLRDAVSHDGFELYFQPIRRASDRRISGFEALLRLTNPEGGQASPAVFVPLAERLGLIVPIGAWVIGHACAVAASWPNDLTVSVNLSPRQFEDGRIVETVREALAATGLAAGRLELEITEGLLLSHTEAVMTQLAKLKALGVRIAMDDFGTGYSSLSYLWRFPFDKLKIDQSFVHSIDEGDTHLASVIEAIVALGRSLNMTITAEGVETEAQAEFLRRAEIDLLQGFHLGRPMPLERLAAAVLHDVRAGAEEAEGPALRRALDG
jgi:diguanylate cyclase (GGDEF)-like protein